MSKDISAAPVSGHGTSIADDPEFVRLRNNYVTSLDPRPVVTQREQDQCRAAWREFVAYIDSRPRSEDSRAKMAEAWQVLLDAGICPGTEPMSLADGIRALATSAAPGRSGKLADDEAQQ